MEITGRIKKVLPLIEGTSQRGPWKKAIIEIEYKSGNFTNMLALENMAKADEFAALPVGVEFNFWFDPVSREYQGRYYTQCNCFNWQAVGQQPAAPQGYQPPVPPQGYAPQAPGCAPQSGGVVDGDCPY